jgi:hypothetical protein
VQLVAEAGVPKGIRLGQPDVKLIQYVGTADDAAVTAVVLRVVALQMVIGGATTNVPDDQAWPTVRQLTGPHRNGNGRDRQPAGNVVSLASRVQDAGNVVVH